VGQTPTSQDNFIRLEDTALIKFITIFIVLSALYGLLRILAPHIKKWLDERKVQKEKQKARKSFAERMKNLWIK